MNRLTVKEMEEFQKTGEIKGKEFVEFPKEAGASWGVVEICKVCCFNGNGCGIGRSSEFFCFFPGYPTIFGVWVEA